MTDFFKPTDFNFERCDNDTTRMEKAARDANRNLSERRMEASMTRQEEAEKYAKENHIQGMFPMGRIPEAHLDGQSVGERRVIALLRGNTKDPMPHGRPPTKWADWLESRLKEEKE